jgi:hypothetical protein
MKASHRIEAACGLIEWARAADIAGTPRRGRVGRCWLAGRRTPGRSGENWDAFRSAAGRADRSQPGSGWSSVQGWLNDLAAEAASGRDGLI